MKRIITIFFLFVVAFCYGQSGQNQAPDYDVLALKNGVRLKVYTYFSTNAAVYFRLTEGDKSTFMLPIDSIASYKQVRNIGNATPGSELIKFSNTAQTGVGLSLLGVVLSVALPLTAGKDAKSKTPYYMPGAAFGFAGFITWIASYSHSRRAGRLMDAKLYR